MLKRNKVEVDVGSGLMQYLCLSRVAISDPPRATGLDDCLARNSRSLIVSYVRECNLGIFVIVLNQQATGFISSLGSSG